MSEQTKEKLDQATAMFYSAFKDFETEEQNYMLINLRDMIYMRRLHELEEMETVKANLENKIKSLKHYNAQIGQSEL